MPKDGQSRTGSVIWLNRNRGYGWIEVDGMATNAYVHHSDIHAGGRYRNLKTNQKVRFNLVNQQDDMLKATDVTILNGDPIRKEQKLHEKARNDGSRNLNGKSQRRPKSEMFEPVGSDDAVTGVVVSFRGKYGWIELDDGSGDAYVHWTEIMGVEGYKKLVPGDRVEFVAIHQEGGKMKAVQVYVL